MAIERLPASEINVELRPTLEDRATWELVFSKIRDHNADSAKGVVFEGSLDSLLMLVDRVTDRSERVRTTYKGKR